MTTIKNITLDIPMAWTFGSREVTMRAIVNTQAQFDELRELFSRARAGIGIQDVPGSRPIGYDHTEDNVNTVYITFTDGNKTRSGWYLLRSMSYAEDTETPLGFAFYMECGFFFLGTEIDVTDGLVLKHMEDLSNDWSM